MTKSYSNLYRLLFVCAVFLLSNFYSFSAFGQCNTFVVDTSFNSRDTLGNKDGFTPVFLSDNTGYDDILPLQNGKMLIMTYLPTTYNGQLFNFILNWPNDPNRYSLLLLNSDGSIDTSFNFLNSGIEITLIRATGDEYDWHQQSDGKILFAGPATYNGNARNLIRLNEDGSLDNTFTSSINGQITQVDTQSDGKIIIYSEGSIYRLNTDGSLDNSFSIHIMPNSFILGLGLELEIDNNDNILHLYYSNSQYNLARLNSDGTTDTNFNPALSGISVFEFDVQPDGKILVSGFVSNTSIQPSMIRLNIDGSLDTNFNRILDLAFLSSSIQSDGKIVGVRDYLPYDYGPCSLVRFNRDGDLDTSFEITPLEDILLGSSYPHKTYVQADGKVITNGLSNIGAITSRDLSLSIGRFNSNGSEDTTFNEGYGIKRGTVLGIIPLTNNRMFIYGDYRSYNNVLNNTLANRRINNQERHIQSLTKINADGSQDNSFYFDERNFLDSVNSTFRGRTIIHCFAVQADEKILLGGKRDNNQKGLVRLNQDGTVDTSFDPSQLFATLLGNSIRNIIVEPNQKILVTDYLSIYRLNTDGSLDNSFNYSNPNLDIQLIKRQTDGKIIVVNEDGIIRLNIDGSLDTSFNTNLNFLLFPTIEIQGSGDILIVDRSNRKIRKINSTGTLYPNFEVDFSDANSFTSKYIHSMKTQADGKIIVAGKFDEIQGVGKSNVCRLNPDGSLDNDFNGIGANSSIFDLLIQSDSSMIAVGAFTTYDGVNRNRIARLRVAAPTSPSLNLQANTIIGLCLNTQATLRATGTGTLYWYNSPTSTTAIAEGDTLRTPLLVADSTYFYVQDSVVGCGSSPRLEILVTTSSSVQANAQNYIAYLDSLGQVEVNISQIDSLSSAGCGNTIASFLFDDTGLVTRSFSCADTNTVHNVILRVTDNNGNIATSPTTIHVKDTIPPTFTTRIVPVHFGSNNQAVVPASYFITALSDNCTDSTDISVVFNHSRRDSVTLYCGSRAIRNLQLRVTDRAGNSVIQSVEIRPTSSIYDFNVDIISGVFRPIIPTTITVVANNYSCAPKSGELKVTLPSDVAYNSASITPNRIVGNNLFWDVTDLSFDRNFVVRISVTPDISLNIGDEVCFIGHITPETNDINLSNNLKTFCFQIGNSYDPNDKQVYPQGICDEKFTKRSDLPLTYTIRFQNTGNAPALNVNIVDSLSNLLHRSSLRVVGTSHPMVVDTVAGNNVINFVFNNINLPDSLSSPELSQGYVIFEVDEIAAHTDTSRINNKSYIYFDTNAPIITNTVKNTIVDVLPQCNPTTPNPPIADCTLPTNLRTEILTSTRVRLLWTTPTNTNAINYEVLRNNQLLATIPASNLSYIDSTLTANTQYNYSIKAICGNSTATSNSVQVRTLPSTPVLLSVIAACKGERGTINVQSAGATYRVYDSETSTTPLFETNNASIETPVLNDSTTFYISVVINGQESQRLEALVPIKEVFDAIVEQGTLLESCATEFTLSAQEVEGATYTWFRENLEVGTSRTLTTTFEARYKVSVVKNGCFDESEFTTTRFVDAPTARIEQGASVTFCGNGTLNAQDTSSNVVYEWILNGNTIGNGTSISVSASGTYTLKASQPSCADSVNVVVTITSAPTNVELTADQTAICTGTETTLSATTGIGFTYKWFRNNTVISNTSASLSTSEIGTYKVEVTTADGCKVETDEVEITQAQAASAVITVNQEGSVDKTITVSSSDSIVSVIWFKDGNEVSSLNNQKTITPTETGNYKAKVVYESGCEFETEEKTFTFDDVTGIEEESAKIFTIYPNPNNGSFKVEFATTTNQKTTLTLVDGLGRIIHSQEIAMNQKTTNITLPKISAGVYVVQIVSEGKVYTKQLIIQ